MALYMWLVEKSGVEIARVVGMLGPREEPVAPRSSSSVAVVVAAAAAVAAAAQERLARERRKMYRKSGGGLGVAGR